MPQSFGVDTCNDLVLLLFGKDHFIFTDYFGIFCLMWKTLKLTETINDYHMSVRIYDHFMSHGPTKSKDQFKVRDLKSLWNSECPPQNHKFEVRPKKTTQPFTFILFCPTVCFWGPNPRQAVAVSSGAYFLAGCCICCVYGVQGISRVTLLIFRVLLIAGAFCHVIRGLI